MALSFSTSPLEKIDSSFPNTSSSFGKQMIVACGWGISGQYGFSVRLLYYLLLIFSLVVRKHAWLATIALATTSTFSATASIHAGTIAISGRFNGNQDIDALWAIISSGCVIAIPLINWSSSVRKEGVRPLLVYWHILMLLALFSLFNISNGRKYLSFISTTLHTRNCVLPTTFNRTLNSVPEITTFLAEHDCKNPCQITPLDYPFLRKPTEPTIQNPSIIYSKTSNVSGALAHLNLPLIILQSLYGFMLHIFSKKTPREVRNTSFDYFLTTRFSKILTFYYLALYSHALIHFIMIFTAAFSIPWFIIIVSVNEAYISVHDTDDESPTSVGQWSPWVNTGLLLLAAVVSRYHHCWARKCEVLMKEGWHSGEFVLRPHGLFHYLCTNIRAPYKDLSDVVAEEWWDLVAWMKDPGRTSDPEEVIAEQNADLAIREEVGLGAIVPTIESHCTQARRRSRTL